MLDRRVFLLSGCSLVAASLPAFAHHGFTGRYDMSKPYWVEGDVDSAVFSPPHPTITVRLAANPAPAAFAEKPPWAKGDVTPLPPPASGIVAVEFPPVRLFYDLQSVVKPGDRIAMLAIMNCRPPNQLRSQWIRLADGTVIEADRRMSSTVDACPAA